MMNHCVPDFDHDYHHFPLSFRSRKSSSMQEDEVMELLWQNGQIVMQRPPKPPPPLQNGAGSSTHPPLTDAPQLFIQEDEMASWLQYPLDDEPQFDRDFCSDLLFPPPSDVTDPTHSNSNRPPPPPKPLQTRRADEDSRRNGFGHFNMARPRQDVLGSAPPVSETVVESNATPVKTAGFETTSLDFTVESSSGASGAEPGLKPSANCDSSKKRKADDIECHSQEVVLKAADTKKQVHGSTAKRTRAAEVHNLSERRRRDRINEKMKALQELVPRCNKSDKASMLDDAIEYLKSLQMQVQMMSMGCGMVPMMFPGMQQYMQPMGMGMGMGVNVNRPMMPFPMATPAHMGPRFPVPSYHPIPPFVAPDASRIQVNNQGSLLIPTGTQNAYQQQAQPIPDSCQPYIGSQNIQIQPPQNNVTALPNSSKVIPSGGPENLEPQHLPG